MNSKVFGLTDVGRRREHNEDTLLVDTGIGVFAVADGMGGHAAGEVASNMAIETLSETLKSEGWPEGEQDTRKVTDSLRSSIEQANEQICQSVQSREEWRGMGTTIVVLALTGGQAVIGHVGDSRAYLLRDGALERLTSDHSWVNEQVKLGLLTDEDAQRHPMRNIVTRALGNRSNAEVDFNICPVQEGDTFLLCSDGLNTMLEDREIRDLLTEKAEDPESACGALVDAANSRGGEDNTTVIVLQIEG